METKRPTCWVIADRGWGRAVAPAQFATLRAIRIRVCAEADALPEEALAGEGNIIAMTAAALRRCDGQSLKRCVEAGAIVHLSRMEEGLEHSLRPFAEDRFRLERRTDVRSYRFGDDHLLPHALRGEELEAHNATLVALGLNGSCRKMATAAGPGEAAAPALFSLKVGKGVVIYDPNSASDKGDDPIVQRLTTACGLIENTGALVAANLAAGAQWQAPPSFNIVIDDRPANFDYLGPLRLRRLLERLSARCPGIHLDLAWTPQQGHVSRRYVELVRRYGGGFVWHGFYRHVDHRTLGNPLAELSRGEESVSDLARRYGVRFQRVMVFPYERTSWDLLARIEQAGFVGVTECAAARAAAEAGMPPFMRGSTATHFVPGIGIPILRRYPASALDRPLMLALATLGHPIIALAHPLDLALRRFALRQGPGRALEHFERLLEFATLKALRAASLEEIVSSLSRA